MTALETAILRTVTYADVFDFPLKDSEIWQYLIGSSTSLSKFHLALGELIQKGVIINYQGYYVLKRRKSIISTRKQRKKIANFKVKKAQQIAQWLRFLPTIWLVGISGALAMNNSPREDDIDLLVISAPHTMWLTRLLVTLVLTLLGVRRKPGDTKITDKICLNMFIDGSRLTLPQREQDLYSAHEAVQFQPLINKHQTHERFLKANKWILKYMPMSIKFSPVSSQLSSSFWSPMLRIFEHISKTFQLWYMRHRTQEVIRKNMLRFHPQDARKWVFQKYAGKLKQLGVDKKSLAL